MHPARIRAKLMVRRSFWSSIELRSAYDFISILEQIPNNRYQGDSMLWMTQMVMAVGIKIAEQKELVPAESFTSGQRRRLQR